MRQRSFLKLFFAVLFTFILVFNLLPRNVFASYPCTVNGYTINCPELNDCSSKKACTNNLECETVPCCKSSGTCTDTCSQSNQCYDLQGHCTQNGYCEKKRVPPGQGGGCQSSSDCRKIYICKDLYCKPIYSYTGSSNCSKSSDCGCNTNKCSISPSGNVSCVHTRLRSGCVDECTSASNCYHWTCNCDTEKCARYYGTQPDDCKPGDYCSCNGPQHKECNANHQCVLVSGSGTNECNTDAACQPKHTICEGDICKWIDGEGVNECRASSDCGTPPPSTTTTTTVPPSSTTTTTPTTEPPSPSCRIMEFTINGKDNEDQNPIMVWVNSVVKGHWLANGFCTDCSIDCSPSGCNWSQNNIGTQGDHQFRITQSNLYTYTLTCWGENQDTDTETLDLKVRAVNLPKWREIIPILPFLRGLFPWGK